VSKSKDSLGACDVFNLIYSRLA